MAMRSKDAQLALLFSVKFQGTTVALPELSSTATLQSLKDAIAVKTLVPSDRQKLTGLFKGRSPPPSASLESLVKGGPLAKKAPPYVLMLMGTPDEVLASTPVWRPSALVDLEEAVARGDANAYPVLAHGLPLHLRTQLLRAHATTHAAAPALRNRRRLQPLKVPMPPPLARQTHAASSSQNNGISSASSSSQNISSCQDRTASSAEDETETDLGAITKSLLWALRGRRSRLLATSREASALAQDRYRTRNWPKRTTLNHDEEIDDDFIGIMVRWAIVAEASRGTPEQNQASIAASVALSAADTSMSLAPAEDAEMSDIAEGEDDKQSNLVSPTMTMGNSAGTALDTTPSSATHPKPSSEVSPENAFEAALEESASARWATAGPVARLLVEAGSGLLSVEVGTVPLFLRSPSGLVLPAPGRAATLTAMAGWPPTTTQTMTRGANTPASDNDTENSDEDVSEEDEREFASAGSDEDGLEDESEDEGEVEGRGQGYRESKAKVEDQGGIMDEVRVTGPMEATSSTTSQRNTCELAAEVCEQYRAVGRFLGACLWHGHPLGAPMPTTFFQAVLDCAPKHLLVLVSPLRSSPQAQSRQSRLSSSSTSNIGLAYGADDGDTFAGFPPSVGRAIGLFRIHRPPPPLGPSSPHFTSEPLLPLHLPSPVAITSSASLESVHVYGTCESAEGTCYLPAHVRYLLGLKDGDRIFVTPQSSNVQLSHDTTSSRAASSSSQANHKSRNPGTSGSGLSIASEVTWAIVALQQSNRANDAIAAATAQDVNFELQRAQRHAEAAARAAEAADKETRWAASIASLGTPQSARSAAGSGRLLVSENKREAARSIAAYKAERDAIKQQKTSPQRLGTQSDLVSQAVGMSEDAPVSKVGVDDPTTLASLLHDTRALHNGVLDVGVGYAFWHPLPVGSHDCEDSKTKKQVEESCSGVVLALTPVALVSVESGRCVAQALLNEATQHRMQRTQSPRNQFQEEGSNCGGCDVTSSSSPSPSSSNTSPTPDRAIMNSLGDGDSSADSSVHNQLSKRKRSSAQLRWRRACSIVRAVVAFQRAGDKQLLASSSLKQFLELACGCDATRRGARLEMEWVLSQRADLLDDRGELPSRFADLGDFANSFVFGAGNVVVRSAAEVEQERRGREGEEVEVSAPTSATVTLGSELIDFSKRGLLRAWLKQRISGDLMPQAFAVAEGLREVVPAPLLCIFTASELQALFGGGDPHVDDSTLRQWRRACVYETYKGNELASTIATTAAAQENSSSSVSSDVKPTGKANSVFDASHPSARGVWECLARASGTERAAVWRFVTSTDAPPPLLSPLWQSTSQSLSGESLDERSADSGGGDDGDSSLFTLALRGPLTASGEANNSSGTDSDFSKSGNSGNNGTRSSSGLGNGVENVARGSDVTDGGSATKGKLFTAATCVRTLYIPHEPFESLAEVAASLAESVALGLHPNLANNDQASSNGEAAESVNDDFTEAQRRLRAAVSSAAARIANGAAAGSGGNTGGSKAAAAAEGSAAVDPLTMRSLFPNSYQCPRCGCGPIDHAACDNLKTHHGERRAGVKVSNACPACGWFSSELADWLPWDGTLE